MDMSKTRQHHKLATGAPLDKRPPTSNPDPTVKTRKGTQGHVPSKGRTNK